MTIDHPHVRNSLQCPTCLGAKDKGVVWCWPCYREAKRCRVFARAANRYADQQEYQLQCIAAR